MANDNRKNQGEQDERRQKDSSPESFPGNPNRQKQDSPDQQHGSTGKKHDHAKLHEDRSVTDRTVRRSVLDTEDDDDDEIDALKG